MNVSISIRSKYPIISPPEINPRLSSVSVGVYLFSISPMIIEAGLNMTTYPKAIARYLPEIAKLSNSVIFPFIGNEWNAMMTKIRICKNWSTKKYRNWLFKLIFRRSINQCEIPTNRNVQRIDQKFNVMLWLNELVHRNRIKYS